jgi:hypothetical protein
MYVRSITVGIVSAIALNLPQLAPSYTLDTTGAVRLEAAGHEARYGIIADEGSPVLSVSLGATNTSSALQLRMPGASLPAAGRYPVGTGVQAFFAAGSPGHPLGWFHGESGTVTISRAVDGHLGGSFEIRARGYLAGDAIEVERWVTVTGSFDAEGDGTTAIAKAN